jgi:hypothetical protein
MSANLLVVSSCLGCQVRVIPMMSTFNQGHTLGMCGVQNEEIDCNPDILELVMTIYIYIYMLPFMP